MNPLDMTPEEFETLHEALLYDYDTDKYEGIAKTYIESSQWTSLHQMVFKDKWTGKLYAYNYQEPLTEYQDANDPDVDSIKEVVLQEKIIYEYVPLKPKTLPVSLPYSPGDPW